MGLTATPHGDIWVSGYCEVCVVGENNNSNNNSETSPTQQLQRDITGVLPGTVRCGWMPKKTKNKTRPGPQLQMDWIEVHNWVL